MSTQLPRSDFSKTDPFREVASMLNTAGALSGKANAALDPAVTAVDYLVVALDDVVSFVTILNDLDEIIKITSASLTALTAITEEIPILDGVMDAIDSAVATIKKAYEVPLKAINEIDRPVKKVRPELDKISNALKTAQKDLALAAEKLPQSARTVELVGALMSILHALIAAFPDDGESSPGGKLRVLMGKWDEVRDEVKKDASAVTAIFTDIKDVVATALAPIGDKFKDAESAIETAINPVRTLILTVKPWGEKIHHAISNCNALKWLVKMMDWLGKAIDWLLDEISLGKLFDQLGNKLLDPILKMLHLDGISKKIEAGLPGETDLKNYLGTLASAPTKLKDLKENLAAYKTGQNGNPLIPLIQAVLDAITGTNPIDTPDAPLWNPPPVVNVETAKQAVANRMKYVSLYQKRGAAYTEYFSALGKLAMQETGRGTRLHGTANAMAAAPGEEAKDFPPPEPLGPDWYGLTTLRNAITNATKIVTPDADEVADLESALAAFEAQVALAPLLEEDMGEISNLWKDVADIVGKVESIAVNTVLDSPIKGFLDAVGDQLTAAKKLAGEAQRFQKNSAVLETLVQQADVALRKGFVNAVSHNGNTYVDALIARYNSWDMQTNTLPRAFAQLAQADKKKAHTSEIAALQNKVNTTGKGLVTVLDKTTNHAGKIRQAVGDLVAELRIFGANAGVMEEPVKRVRDHQEFLHTIDHYLGVADSILDPLSWLLKNYVCKDQKTFAPIQSVVRNLQTWGKGQIGTWLEQGVRAAIDGLSEAETHITAATISLSKVNDALEKDGIAKARISVGDINLMLSELDKDLTLQDTKTGTDWLTVDLNLQLETLATGILGS